MTPFPMNKWLAGLLPGAVVKVRAYQSLGTFVDFPTPSNFVEADFPSYKPYVFGKPPPNQPLQDGTRVWSFGLVSWVFPQSNAPGCTIRGIYLTAVVAPDPEVVIFWAELPAPVPMLKQGDVFSQQTSIAAQTETVPLVQP